MNLCKDTQKLSTYGRKQLEKNEKSQKIEHISDSDTSDEELVTYPCFPTTVEDRHYGTIPGSALATRAVLSHSTAQTNSTVERYLPHQKTKVKKLHKEKIKNQKTKRLKQKMTRPNPRLLNVED